MPTDPDTEQRVPLNRERVLRAAIALADSAGIEALTMRSLGKAVGVEAMSLYNHVANKDDVLNGMVDLIVSEIALPSPHTDWKLALRQSAISAHETLLRHPWACGLWTSSQIWSARLRFGDALLRSLREAPFSKEITYHAYHVLESYIVGYTRQEVSYTFVADDLPDLGAAFLRQLSATEYPYFTEHVMQHLEPDHGDIRAFEFGLDLILDSLDRLRETS
ncbi:MAG TPA: TetR/AcrR family transcriptional regulator C-terminal domain-containing protein [Ktedonobacterales bacterium]|jgi:AcrR family transcriptional regulator